MLLLQTFNQYLRRRHICCIVPGIQHAIKSTYSQLPSNIFNNFGLFILFIVELANIPDNIEHTQTDEPMPALLRNNKTIVLLLYAERNNQTFVAIHWISLKRYHFPQIQHHFTQSVIFTQGTIALCYVFTKQQWNLGADQLVSHRNSPKQSLFCLFVNNILLTKVLQKCFSGISEST